jgi:uncharacterized protein YciI
MLFVVINTDRPGQLDLRMATRPAHLEYLDKIVSHLVQGGAILDAEGKPCGSAIILEAENLEAAHALVSGDPYAKAGLFESSVIRPFRQAFRDGARV